MEKLKLCDITFLTIVTTKTIQKTHTYLPAVLKSISGEVTKDKQGLVIVVQL